MKTSELLKIALQIVEAKENGNPIEWELSTSDGRWASNMDYPGSLMQCLADRKEIRIKPWTLGRSINGFTLADGQEWHRQDWTKEMLPEGYRPLLVGESYIAGDEYYSDRGKCWAAETYSGNLATYADSFHRRTTRPPPEKWAKEKAAFAEGKQIQAMGYNGWYDCYPQWSEHGEYRIKPEPEMIELGPEDVPPGSVFRQDSWEAETWMSVMQVHYRGVDLADKSEISYGELRKDLWLIHRPSKPGVWERCEKEKV